MIKLENGEISKGVSENGFNIRISRALPGGSVLFLTIYKIDKDYPSILYCLDHDMQWISVREAEVIPEKCRFYLDV